MLEGLYYSEKDQILFYVGGCCGEDAEAHKIIKMIKEGIEVIIRLVPVSEKRVKTYFNLQEGRYKNMRIFYLKTEIIPSRAHNIKNQSMLEWLAN